MENISHHSFKLGRWDACPMETKALIIFERFFIPRRLKIGMSWGMICCFSKHFLTSFLEVSSLKLFVFNCFWIGVQLYELEFGHASFFSSQYKITIWAPAKTSDILEQLHQDIDTWYHHETLRNDRGDTKNDDSWYTCSPDFIANIKSSGTMRDTQKTMTISATSFRGCNRFSPLLIYFSSQQRKT